MMIMMTQKYDDDDYFRQGAAERRTARAHQLVFNQKNLDLVENKSRDGQIMMMVMIMIKMMMIMKSP